MQTSTADLGLLGPNCQRQSCYPLEIYWKFYMCNFSQVNFCIPNKAFHGKTMPCIWSKPHTADDCKSSILSVYLLKKNMEKKE